MMRIKLSSKRQATFPKQVCESLGIQPGDEIVLDHRMEADSEVWLLKPAREESRSWLGSLRDYAAGKAHEMEAVCGSIARGRASGKE